MASREKNRSYLAVVDVKSKRFMQLASKQIPNISIDPRSKTKVLLGTNPNAYNKMRSWDYPGFSDFYLVDINTGKSRKLADKRAAPLPFPPGENTSPGGMVTLKNGFADPQAQKATRPSTSEWAFLIFWPTNSMTHRMLLRRIDRPAGSVMTLPF